MAYVNRICLGDLVTTSVPNGAALAKPTIPDPNAHTNYVMPTSQVENNYWTLSTIRA